MGQDGKIVAMILVQDLSQDGKKLAAITLGVLSWGGRTLNPDRSGLRLLVKKYL